MSTPANRTPASSKAIGATPSARRPIAPTVLLRALIPAAALGAAIAHMAGGEASLPLWAWKLAVRLDMDGDTAVRLLASAEATIAIIIACSSRLARPTAVLAIALLAFAAVAEVSALISISASPADFAVPVVTLAFAGALAIAMGRWVPPRDASSASSIGVGSVLAALAALTFSLGAMARLPVSDRPKPIPAAMEDSSGIRFRDLDALVGKTLPDAGIAAHQPMLTAMTLEGRHILVFYNPHCGECREVFEVFFGGRPHPEVIAVEVPLPKGAIVAPGDPAFVPDCPECRHTKLAPGPAYFRRTPVVMVVQDGRITCVESVDPQRCIDP